MKTWLLLTTAAFLGCGPRAGYTTYRDETAFVRGKYAETEIRRVYGSGEKRREVVYDPNKPDETFKVLDGQGRPVEVRSYQLDEVVVCMPQRGGAVPDAPVLPGYPPGCLRFLSAPEGLYTFQGDDPCRLDMLGRLKCW